MKIIENNFKFGTMDIRNTTEPRLEEQVSSLEQTYGMTRWQREGILAEGSLYSEYTKSKAQEIEDLAKELREVSK